MKVEREPFVKPKRPPSHGLPSQRQMRVAEMVRHALSAIFLRGEVHDPQLDAMRLSVGEVRLSPDLRVATVYVLPLGGEKKAENLILLQKMAGRVRHELANKVELKFAPELRFHWDQTFDQMQETDRLLGNAWVRQDLDTPKDAG